MRRGRPTVTTVAQALDQARQAGLDRLDARWLLAWVLGQDSTWLLAHDSQPLQTGEAQRYGDLCRRRAAGEPYAYLTGEVGFHGLSLQVNPAVLVPRPDTETLVDWALVRLATDLANRPQPEVVDLGTGSGAIALAVKRAWPQAILTAVDSSPAALAQAQANGQRLHTEVEWLHSDWWQALSGRRFDLVLSNPPYIAAGDPHLRELGHEPQLALSPGGDGLDALRRVIAGAPDHLRPGGIVLLEHGWDQGQAVLDLLAGAGFDSLDRRQDLGRQWRCSAGRWPGTG